MKRIGILQICQESNHFNPVLTTQADFESFLLGSGAEGLEKFAAGEEVGGFLDGLKNWSDDVQPVGLFMAQAWSSGPLTKNAKEWFVDNLRRQLGRAGRLDGILFSLHGALVAEDDPDADGLFLEHVRDVVGPEVPVVGTLDLHAYLTPKMTRCADALVAYHTSPHIDRFATGRRAARVLDQILSGAQPAVAVRRLPMNTIGEVSLTSGPVLAPIFERLSELEASAEVLCASVLMVQPWLDVPDLGWTVMVVTDNDDDLAQRLCDQLADMCWPRRTSLTVKYDDARQAIARALAWDGKPVVIADGADATNSGAPGDSIHLLREMMDKEITDGALTFMVDPEAVAHAKSVSAGGKFDFAVGGKRDRVFSKPLHVKGQVSFLRPARYVLSGHGGDNLPIDMGTGAAVRIGNVVLLLVERTGPGSTPMMYRCVGLEPRNFKIVVVKSPAGFRADFGSFAAGIILSDCPGCASPRLAELPYTRISRPVWPHDDIDDWRSVEWCRQVWDESDA